MKPNPFTSLAGYTVQGLKRKKKKVDGVRVKGGREEFRVGVKTRGVRQKRARSPALIQIWGLVAYGGLFPGSDGGHDPLVERSVA